MAGLLVAACRPNPVPVDLPPASPDVTSICRSLAQALPAQVDGRDRVETVPTSPRTAAWGDPPLVLRCGVGQPTALTPASEIIEVNGVEWFPQETNGGYIFTTFGRAAYIELVVPSSVERSEATAPLVDLAEPVKRHVSRVSTR